MTGEPLIDPWTVPTRNVNPASPTRSLAGTESKDGLNVAAMAYAAKHTAKTNENLRRTRRLREVGFIARTMEVPRRCRSDNLEIRPLRLRTASDHTMHAFGNSMETNPVFVQEAHEPPERRGKTRCSSPTAWSPRDSNHRPFPETRQRRLFPQCPEARPKRGETHLFRHVLPWSKKHCAEHHSSERLEAWRGLHPNGLTSNEWSPAFG